MKEYLEPINDGLIMRDSGAWVEGKLDYLRRYIDVFETSMRKKWPRRHFIDLFAGPGKCLCRGTGEVILGSPLIALTTRFPFTDYFFVDVSSQNISVLEQRCEASPLKSRVRTVVGDANVVVSDIVQQIRGTSSLNLAFLDPDGLDLQWNTVAALAQIERVDLIIHYSQSGLNRFMPQAYQKQSQTKVDLFFGDDEWRDIYGRYRQQEEAFLHRTLMDHYKQKLGELGYKQALRDDEVGIEPVIRSDRNAPLYRLIFASKHPLGHGFWNKITSRDVHGQRRLL